MDDGNKSSQILNLWTTLTPICGYTFYSVLYEYPSSQMDTILYKYRPLRSTLFQVELFLKAVNSKRMPLTTSSVLISYLRWF